MKFYVQTQINMQAKNKAWHNLQIFARKYDGSLIIGERACANFIDFIKETIDEANEANPRCTNLIFDKQNHNDHTVVSAVVHPDECFTMSFLPIKRELE